MERRNIGGSNLPPKYLVYRSTTKVEMLTEQLDPGRFEWELAAAAGVPGFKADVKRRQRPASETRKLNRVLDELESQHLIGTVDEPKAYFRGEMNLSWGRFGGHWSSGDLVFFSGLTDKTVVGLGGSEAHVLRPNPAAMPEGRSVFTPNSYTPYIMDVLNREFPVDMHAAGLYPAKTGAEAVAHAMSSVMAAYADRHGPEERMEFVAKRLLHWQNDHRYDYIGHKDGLQLFDRMTHVLLGTPLYVALVE